MRLTRFGHPVLAAAAIVALVIPAVAAGGQKETETVNKTIALPAHGTLRLKTFSGAVHITPASGNDIVMKAVRSAKREQLDHIKLDIQTSGDTVTINANTRDDGWDDHKDNVVETTFDLQVPASAMLDINGFSSDLDIRGISGDQTIETFSGDITIDTAKGAIKAKTFSGRIDVNLAAAGDSPVLSAQTFSGRIKARLASNAKGQVNFDTFSGQFDSELPLTIHTMGHRKTSGDLPGGAGGSTLKFHTFSGDVQVMK
jgi:DUF4097 and DUF4098 domain-containing protein YvlB